MLRSSDEALELYSGYFFKIIKKAMRDGEFDESIEICILSAKHGLIESTDVIGYYDKKMDSERATELRQQVTRDISQKCRMNDYERVIINVGNNYKCAIGDLSALSIPVDYIKGDGIGYKGSKLKKIVRGKVSLNNNGGQNVTS